MSAEVSITETPETPEEKLARLIEVQRVRKAARDALLVDREIQRRELIERFVKELGPLGSEFNVYDSGHLEDPLVVVKRPALVQWTKLQQSEMTPADTYEFVVPSVVHPEREEYNAARQKRIGIETGCLNQLVKLIGLVVEKEAKK